ncbi:uncharacterized protein J3R85_000257 [Psidium guajava]|nr:uncharacterized protein J3R85_000257 [Psidium guajava]
MANRAQGIHGCTCSSLQHPWPWPPYLSKSAVSGMVDIREAFQGLQGRCPVVGDGREGLIPRG